MARPVGNGDALNTVAQQTVGRKATQEEQRMFVSMFHALQTNAQLTPSGGTYVTPDVDSQAEAYLRQSAPLEAAGHDIANTMNSFLKIIKGVG